MTGDDSFDIALRAFGLFTRDEQKAALARFATLRYPRVEDRFVEAVHSVIVDEAARRGYSPRRHKEDRT